MSGKNGHAVADLVGMVATVEALGLVFGAGVAALVGAALERFWFARRLISGRELVLEKEIATLRFEVTSMKEQLFESVRREATALRQVTELSEMVRNLVDEIETIRTAQNELQAAVLNRRLLLVLGNDDAFRLDLAAMRAVRTKTKLEFVRVQDADKAKVERQLIRARTTGKPFAFVHIAAHGDDTGVSLGGEVVSWDWLSGVLDGVEVLLLAACESSTLGDWLGVVPFVVSISERVVNENAALFTQAFWGEIGRGVAPSEAFDNALARCPADMQEYVTGHW